MRPRLTVLVIGLGALVRVSAAQQPPRLPPVRTTDSSVNALTVQNERKVPVTIYVDYGRFDRRLGVVPPFNTVTLPIPAWAVQGRTRVQLFAHPEGETDDLASRAFTLAPPGRLAMVIPARGTMPAPLPGDTMTAVLPPEALSDATLTVDNPRATAVTVFADAGNYAVRLGRVPARTRATLRFPRSVVLPDQSVRVFVDPDGGSDLGSQLLHIRAGQHLGLRVPPE